MVARKSQFAWAGNALNLNQHGLVADLETIHRDGSAFQLQFAILAEANGFTIDGRQRVVGQTADAGQLDLAQPNWRGRLGDGASCQ